MPKHLSEAGSSYIPAGNEEKNKTAPWLMFIYEAKIADSFRNITVTWCKNLVKHYISFNVENLSDDQHHCTCKIDLQASQFWNKKGLKNFEVDGRRVYIYWDFRQAKFSSDSPAPTSDYYVAIVDEEEIVLLLGDLQNDAYKRTKKRPAFPEATLLCKKENVYGKKLFCTRSILGDGGKEHDIVIENSLLGPGDPEMWISIDGITTIRILNLHWRFRGNETISVNDTTLQIFWDVHDWLFNESSTSYGLFIFNPTTISDGSDDIYDSGQGFCHILYAWKLE
ncbi:DUF868 family protein (DUF868) [Melia azedarach]|uniref:DUF868 family protein (DUF868) n=1 Tax=Melia azedarach TaxID=155640 RepID=A0ACC1YQD0_MELAZ|nr:DUF868 family protein (DUF868) [Melia azedarach]